MQVADHTRYLSDPDGILSNASRTEIDSTLSRVRRETSAEVAAVIVGDIDDDIDIFANRLYNSWGLGKKDNNNGVLILVARDARKAVIRTGRGSEGVLPDIVCAHIMREKMFPAFREGDYDRGMTETVSAVAEVITDPDAAAELQSKLKDNYGRSDVHPFRLYIFFCVILALSCLAALLLKVPQRARQIALRQICRARRLESAPAHRHSRRSADATHRVAAAVAAAQTLAQQPAQMSQLRPQDDKNRRGP